jgi:tetratricopeptide (TPR) repeat protein
VILAGHSVALGQLPPVYARCANVEANASVAIPACSEIIQSGHDSGRQLAITFTNRGIAWAKESQIERAIADLKEAIRVDPSYARTYSALGLAYAQRGNLDQAIAELDQAISINPRFVQAYNNRGWLFRKRHEVDRALSDLNMAIFIDPTYPLAYFNRAQVWRDKGNLDLAITDVDRGLQFDPRNATAYADRAVFYELKGDRVHALAAFQSALAINPSHAVALAGQARLTAAATASNNTIATVGRGPAVVPPTLINASIASVPPQVLVQSPATIVVNAVALPTNSASPSQSPTNQAIAVHSLSEALAACSKLVDGQSQTGIEISNGTEKLMFPAGYHGRKHLDCVVSALSEEATAIDRDYGEIVRANYPNLRDATAICQIEPARLDEHIARAKTFDARAQMLQKSFEANAAIIEQVRNALGKINLGSITDSASLMKSILQNVGEPVDQAALRLRDVLQLMQRIDASQKAMMTVQSVRKLICP